MLNGDGPIQTLNSSTFPCELFFQLEPYFKDVFTRKSCTPADLAIAHLFKTSPSFSMSDNFSEVAWNCMSWTLIQRRTNTVFVQISWNRVKVWLTNHNTVLDRVNYTICSTLKYWWPKCFHVDKCFQNLKPFWGGSFDFKYNIVRYGKLHFTLNLEQLSLPESHLFIYWKMNPPANRWDCQGNI